ncbi:MAG: GDP-L-fucose synthase [Bdellovibrionales bacterium]
MKVFITGASGLVGKNIVDEFRGKNFELFTPTSRDLDLTKSETVYEYIESIKPDLIIHCAGRVGGIHANIAHPVDFLVQNLDMGRNVVLAARHAGIKKLINLGSSCMYPKHFSESITEDQVLKGELEPTNEGYALAKIATQRLCEYIRREDNSFCFKTLIPCNIYGRYDKFDPKHSHLVPAIIKKVHDAKLAGDPSGEIWGDGESRREFMYAGDLAKIILSCIDQIYEIPDIMNVGLGHDYTINEYYQIASEVIGFKGEFTHDLSKPTGMKRKLVNVDKMHSLGINHQTTLEEGIANTYEYFKNEVS